MKNVQLILILMLVASLAACGGENHPEDVVLDPNPEELVAEFGFNDSLYAVGGNETLAENIGEELGTLETVVEEVQGNGELVLYAGGHGVEAGAKVYEVVGNEDNTILAVKDGNTYYTAIFRGELE